MEYYRTFHLVDALDRIALLVSLWITTAHEHHADSCTLIKLDGSLVQVTISHALEEIHDVALQAKHHALGLWVAHTAVVLDDHRLALYVDQTEEDETLVVDVLLSQALYGRTDDAVFHLLHPLLALVVLSLRQNLVVLAIGQDEYGALDAAQEFLNHHTRGSVAKHTAEHLLELLLGLFEGREDENALASAQAVSLQYVRSLQGLQKLQAFLYSSAVEGLILGCRDIVTLHELLGEVLAAFQYGTSLRWTNHWDVLGTFVSLEVIIDTLYQWVFRTNYHHVNTPLDSKVLESLEVVSLDVYVLANLLCAGVTWSDKKFLYFLALGDFPC